MARGCCDSLVLLAVEAGVLDASTIGASAAAVAPSAVGVTPAAAAAGAWGAVVVVRLEAAGVDSGAAVDSDATTVAFGWLEAAPPGSVAAISPAKRATLLRRTCRAAATTTAAIAASARHSRPMHQTRPRLGRPFCTDTVAASDGGPTALDASSADFTALAKRSSISLLGANLGLAYRRMRSKALNAAQAGSFA